MITTGLNIPEAVLKRLATAVAAMRRATADMTIAEWRKAYRERHGPTLACFVYAHFTKSGAVKSFDARRIDKSIEKFRARGFETDVSLLGPAQLAAGEIAQDCAEFLLRREIDQRRSAGHRELVQLSDDELSVAAKELAPLANLLSAKAVHCGSLSERLRRRLIQDEIALRGNESNHQRLTAKAKNADYIAACRKRVDAEIATARKWREYNEGRPYYQFYVNRDFENRSEDDQTLIAYRNAMGWQP